MKDMDMDKKLKVLFIAGNGRSGSTILHNILGQIDRFFAIGELRHIWERGSIKNRLCGCGVPFHDCETWQNIMTTAFGSLENIDSKQMYRYTESFRIQNLPSTWVPSIRRKKIAELNTYLTNLEKLYQAIQTTTGSKVIVDSSKNPSYGYLLQSIPSISLYVLHLTRDSQAVAYSWSKKKEFQPGDFMARKTPVKSALQWNARNLSAEAFLRQKPQRYMRLRYEDFVANPQKHVNDILAFADEPGVTTPFVSENTVVLNQANHSVFGNPVRFQQGLVTLRLDDKWQSKMNLKQKLTVKALTLPLRLKYRYL